MTTEASGVWNGWNTGVTMDWESTNMICFAVV